MKAVPKPVTTVSGSIARKRACKRTLRSHARGFSIKLVATLMIGQMPPWQNNGVCWDADGGCRALVHACVRVRVYMSAYVHACACVRVGNGVLAAFLTFPVGAGSRCEFNDKVYPKCFNKAIGITCSTLQKAEGKDECLSGRHPHCEWSGELCVRRGQEHLCRIHGVSKNSCDGIPSCKWHPRAEFCMNNNPDFVPQCARFGMNKEVCEAADHPIGCAWEYNSGMCTEIGKNGPCESQKTEIGCYEHGTRGGCTWRNGMCSRTAPMEEEANQENIELVLFNPFLLARYAM